MRRAYCLIREAPWYRRDAFIRGLNAAGLEVHCQQPAKPDEQTVLVIWNRYGGTHEVALRVERAGGRVLVAENGYLGAGGTSPKFDVHPGGPKPGHYYALAEGWHNGRGRWNAGGPERFAALGVSLKPWRAWPIDQGYVLVAANRSFGVGEQVMPVDWAERAAESAKRSGFKVLLRKHPGNNESPNNPLAVALKGARAVMVWSSSVGLHALAEGIPVQCSAPYWICKTASVRDLDHFDRDEATAARAAAMQRMAWAQWTVEEIVTGEPFQRLLA